MRWGPLPCGTSTTQGSPCLGSAPAFPSATRHLTLDAPLQNYRLSFSTVHFWSPTCAFCGSTCAGPSVKEASPGICIFPSLAPVCWSFLIPSPLHPDGSSIFSSVPLLCPGHRPLVPLTAVCSGFPHTSVFRTRPSSLGYRNSVMLFLCPQYQDSSSVHLELELRKRDYSHNDGF